MIVTFMRAVSLPALLIGLVWSTLYFLLDGGHHRTLHALTLLFATTSIGITIVGRTVVPGFVGALVVGMMIANIPPRFGDDIGSECKSAISSIALVIILSRAGMGLDVATLKSRVAILTWLSLAPNIVDIVAGMLLARVFLALPWGWCALVGFILPAVSPAVVVPGSLALQKEGYGVEKGLTTIVVAATAIGDVFCIAGFSVCISLVLHDGSNIAWTIGRVFIEILVGVGSGTLIGYALTSLFPSTTPLPSLTRCALLLGFGSTAVLGAKRIEWNAAGSLFVLVLGVICGRRWSEGATINVHLSSLWNYVIAPLLFGTIGASMDFKELSWTNVGYACDVVVLTVIIRAVFTTYATPTSAFTLREKGFLACAGIPKATVQAALASVPLNALENETGIRLDYGRAVLAVGVVSIVLTAPVGALLIRIVGKRWLTKVVLADWKSRKWLTTPAKTKEIDVKLQRRYTV